MFCPPLNLGAEQREVLVLSAVLAETGAKMKPSSISDYPWIQSPLIANAPMAGFAGASLATQVSLHGGMGMIGAGFSMEELNNELSKAQELMKEANDPQSQGMLRVGVGFLLFVHPLEDVLDIVKKYRPVVVWLFAAKEINDYARWATALRNVAPEVHIWIQVGSVADATEINLTAKPNAIVAQGSDAGGHGLERGASIISLVPEISDALARLDIAPPLLLASGGIADRRGVAASLALGARGVVLGSRFLCSEEVKITESYRQVILAATDGGQITTRAKVFDEMRGPNIWPDRYDGRSVITQSYLDYRAGVEMDEIRELRREAEASHSGGYGDTVGSGRVSTWAGTGIGLFRRVQKSADILDELREGST